MSRKTTKQVKKDLIILNTLKLKSPYICPNCGERHYVYIYKKRKIKGIEFGEFYYEGGLFRKDYYGSWYHCHTCGHNHQQSKSL